MPFKLRAASCALAAAGLAALAQPAAASVLYDVVVDNFAEGSHAHLTFDLPDYVTPYTAYAADTCDATLNGFAAYCFVPTLQYSPFLLNVLLGVTPAPVPVGFVTEFAFDGADAFTPGSYELALPSAHLTLSVTEVASPVGGVPEPATWSLMILGFGLSGATLRRRTRSSPVGRGI